MMTRHDWAAAAIVVAAIALVFGAIGYGFWDQKRKLPDYIRGCAEMCASAGAGFMFDTRNMVCTCGTWPVESR